MDDLTKEFIAESLEGLERMERCLTELERQPDDGELMAEVFRAVHTIKGSTGFLGFSRLEMLAHAGEHLLVALRDGKIVVNSDRIGGLLELMDGLRAILRLIEVKGSEGERARDDDHELIARLAELKSETIAPVGVAGMGAAGAETTLQNRGAQQPIVGERRLPLEPRPVRGPEGPLKSQSLQPKSESVPPNSQSRDASSDSGQAVGLAVSAGTAAAPDKTLRIDVEVLNRMMNLVGELVLTRNQILQSAPGAENFPELARRLDGVTAELRESVMQARMQPVGHLFSKFPRMVRDLARTCERQVRIEFVGQETGLDKSLLEAIRDPLTHAVRNSVDHGIEPPKDRLKAGKSAEGVVRLRAFHHGGSVVIEVTDDGAGISVERVLAKAVERGLVTAEQAGSMSEREALQLVFVAGFSTAKEVTSISGRGVGMDVVRSNVEKVGGSVELESRVGLGTTVRLRVPLTLAIVPALVLRSGGESFALPQNSLEELVYVLRRDVEAAVERIGTVELYRLRELLLPLVWLDGLLGLERTPDPAHGIYIAVVESEGCRFGLVVDDLMAPEEIVVKPLSSVLREIGVFSGATVLGSGKLAMILDVAAIGARAGVRPTEARMVAIADANAENLPKVAQALEMENAMVIYELRAGERMAMPLRSVERIETVALGEIEFAAGQAVLQYRGELLALEDEGNMLAEMQAAGGNRTYGAPVPEVAAGEVTMLVCLRSGARGVKRVGVIVRRVLDVSNGTLLAADEAVYAGQLAMVKDRVTPVHREPRAWTPMLKDVA